MKQRLIKLAIAMTTIVLSTLFSAGFSVDSAQARVRLYVTPGWYYNPYRVDPSVGWYAVRAYYQGGPWSGPYYSYTGWSDYASRNGIGCTPGTIVKGGDAINYVCQ